MILLICETDPEPVIEGFRRNVDAVPSSCEMMVMDIMNSYKDEIYCVCGDAGICVNGGQSQRRTCDGNDGPTIFPSRSLDDGELGIASGKNDESYKNETDAVSEGHHPMVRRGVVIVVGKPFAGCCRARHVDGCKGVDGVTRGGSSLGR